MQGIISSLFRAQVRRQANKLETWGSLSPVLLAHEKIEGVLRPQEVVVVKDFHCAHPVGIEVARNLTKKKKAHRISGHLKVWSSVNQLFVMSQRGNNPALFSVRTCKISCQSRWAHRARQGAKPTGGYKQRGKHPISGE